jgi:calcineurin-like phosphoesterase
MPKPMDIMSTHIMNDQHNARYVALHKVITFEDIALYLYCDEHIDMVVDGLHTELVASDKQCVIAALSDGPRRIVVKIHGFKV